MPALGATVNGPKSPALVSPMPIPTWLEVRPGSIWQSVTRSA